MVILGFLSILQMFLPGWIITRFIHLRSWLQQPLISFALSLIFNQVVVICLVTLKIYTHTAVISLLIIEAVILMVWWLVQYQKIKRSFWLWKLSLIDPKDLLRYIGYLTLFLVAIASIGLIVAKVISVNPGIFTLGDDFGSYNIWALLWYHGHFPYFDQNNYPQLIPANWSLMYQIIGNEDIQIFIKAVMGLFPIFLLLSIFDLFRTLRKPAFLAGLIFSALFISMFVWAFIGSGHLDIPLAFLGLMSISLFIPYMLEAHPKSIISYIILAAVLAGTAALTKKAGLLMLSPLLIGSWLVLRWHHFSTKEIIKWLLTVLLVFSLIASLWYGQKIFQSGSLWGVFRDYNVKQTRITQVPTMYGRFVFANEKLLTQFGKVVTKVSSAVIHKSMNNNQFTLVWQWSISIIFDLVILLLIIYAWPHPLTKYLLFSVIIPCYIFWSLFACYDFRNLVLILPLVGIVVGFGLFNILNRIFHYHFSLPNNHPSRVIQLKINLPIISLVFWITVTIMVLGLQSSFPDNRLYAFRERALYHIGIDKVNQALYSLYRQSGFQGKIGTSYEPLAYLPEINSYAMFYSSEEMLTESIINHLDADSSVKFILWQDIAIDPNVSKYIQEQINNRQYRLIFDIGGYSLWNIKA